MKDRFQVRPGRADAAKPETAEIRCGRTSLARQHGYQRQPEEKHRRVAEIMPRAVRDRAARCLRALMKA